MENLTEVDMGYDDESQPVKSKPLPMYQAIEPEKSLVECFPFPEIRPAQKLALEAIEKGLVDGKKVFMLDIPTGGGKSPIVAALSRFFGSSYILTGTKDLQKQYLRDFKWMVTGKGKGNFECYEVQRMGLKIESREDLMCSNGPCSTDSGYKCPYKTQLKDYGVTAPNTPDEKVTYNGVLDPRVNKPCQYYDQKYRAMTASHSVFNMAMFCTNAFYGQGLRARKMIAIDEAHELESHLTEFLGMKITKKQLSNFFENYDDSELPQDFGEDMKQWAEYLEHLAVMIENFIKEAKRKQEAGNNNPRYSPKNVTDAKKTLDKIKEVVIDFSVGNIWIVSGIVKDTKNSDRVVKVSFKPLDIKPVAQRLFYHGDIIVLLSATILGKKAMCEILGFKEEDVVYVQTDSDFPAENRPIYNMNLGKYSAKTEVEMLPKFAAYVDKIMTKHANQKGIIHVTKKAHMKAIEEALSPENRRRLLKSTTDDEFVDREQLIAEHTASEKPTVILSPSFHTGADLKDDLSRFQILFKVPYLDLGDRVIAARANKSQRWYNWQTILKVIQSTGRSVRHKNDWATTYILDSNIAFLLWKAGDDGMIPNWWKKAVIKASPEGLDFIPKEIIPK